MPAPFEGEGETGDPENILSDFVRDATGVLVRLSGAGEKWKGEEDSEAIGRAGELRGESGDGRAGAVAHCEKLNCCMGGSAANMMLRMMGNGLRVGWS